MTADDEPIERYGHPDFLLCHWAPTSRRASITRHGLVPGKLSTCGEWRPPYVCFSESPALAWSLSGGTGRGKHIDSWDLWTCWSDAASGMEAIPFDNGDTKEWRVYERIFKRDLWYVATRTQTV